MNDQLHIVSFDVPYPPDYGGVIDIYYKIKALSELGVKVHLHCFEYGRGQKHELNKICSSVTYHKRNLNKIKLLYPQPFIMITRNSKLLVKKLIQDDYPVLLEGLHLGNYIPILKKNKKKVFIRTHNIEHSYYKGIASAESLSLKKSYFFLEAIKLKYAERVLSSADRIFSISKKDHEYFNLKYGHSDLVRAFHAENEVKGLKGKGEYALYHGNLSVSENIKAIKFLMDEVFNDLDIKLIIAGKDPNLEIVKKVNNRKNIELLENPDQEQMDQLILNAQILVLPTFQETGLKLKMLKSLYLGRYIVLNKEMMGQEKLQETCVVCKSKDEWKNVIIDLIQKEFSEFDIEKRKISLKEYSNLYNVSILKKRIFNIV